MNLSDVEDVSKKDGYVWKNILKLLRFITSRTENSNFKIIYCKMLLISDRYFRNQNGRTLTEVRAIRILGYL